MLPFLPDIGYTNEEPTIPMQSAGDIWTWRRVSKLGTRREGGFLTLDSYPRILSPHWAERDYLSPHFQILMGGGEREREREKLQENFWASSLPLLQDQGEPAGFRYPLKVPDRACGPGALVLTQWPSPPVDRWILRAVELVISTSFWGGPLEHVEKGQHVLFNTLS